jgi:MYXO-CTERM domain-containing protein
MMISCKRPNFVMPRLVASALLMTAVTWPTLAAADVEIETEAVRDYQLPGDFDISGAQVLLGADGSTLLTNTMGMIADEARCAVVVATDSEARLVEYRYDGAPTQCNGVIAHPDGGFFVRGSNPAAMEGEVSGVTAYIGPDDNEVWAIADQTLVDANPEPNGTGEFRGAYETPHPAMAYSPELDKLLAFTVGKLTIGSDEKFLSQAHVVNVESGTLTKSGQTFGLSGVGLVGGTTVRASDGHFLIYYYSSGDRGAFFYDYNGRQDIEFFKPRGEDWDDRFVSRMVYENELLHLLWTPTGSDDPQTRVTATTDAGAELWSVNFEPEYIFAGGKSVDLGRPLSMWVGAENTVILHQGGDQLYLRVLDVNGDSPGVARLEGATEFAPVAIVNGSGGSLKLISFDSDTRQVYEDALTFVDVEDFDPDAGIPDGGIPGDVGIPADIGIKEVLEAAGCCATISGHRQSPAPFGLLALLFLFVRRRDRSA